ncbi:helix-turn-helix transcriptional regulator [Massilia atriviolacea]|uniref:Transcriptional regulator n=1 Tax=Massilia atriviolacea TaxID=2495579 RepID=A0A430HR64_9BURK|nr:helix-turn-helix transcriptional regulator [Massilia atriviolacea]RSZ60006.1 transcriptional regulator [Massilia atriviolacea]
MRTQSKFSPAQHRANTDLMLAYLEKHGPLIAHNLAAAIGLPKPTVQGYLFRVMRAGEAHSQRQRGENGKVACALYWFGPGDKAPLDIEIQSCRTVKTFPMHAVRDPLVAALFGQAVRS